MTNGLIFLHRTLSLFPFEDVGPLTLARLRDRTHTQPREAQATSSVLLSMLHFHWQQVAEFVWGSQGTEGVS